VWVVVLEQKLNALVPEPGFAEMSLQRGRRGVLQKVSTQPGHSRIKLDNVRQIPLRISSVLGATFSGSGLRTPIRIINTNKGVRQNRKCLLVML
jgi:hypothetical protein